MTASVCGWALAMQNTRPKEALRGRPNKGSGAALSTAACWRCSEILEPEHDQYQSPEQAHRPPLQPSRFTCRVTSSGMYLRENAHH